MLSIYVPSPITLSKASKSIGFGAKSFVAYAINIDTSSHTMYEAFLGINSTKSFEIKKAFAFEDVSSFAYFLWTANVS